MSDKTLFNQDLTLNSLTLNNSTDSDASGYTPKSTVINSSVVSTGQVVTSQITLYNTTGTSPNPPSLYTANDNVQILTASDGGLQLINTAGQSTTLITSSTGLTVNDNISAPTFTVGTGSNVCSVQSPAFNTIAFGGANTGNIECGNIECNNVTATQLTLNGNGSTLSSVFNTNSSNNAYLSTTGVDTGLILSTGAGQVKLAATGSNLLTINPGLAGNLVVGGNIRANTFSGGLECYAVPINITLTSGQSQTFSEQLTFNNALNVDTFAWFFQPVWSANTNYAINLTSVVQGSGIITITFSVTNYSAVSSSLVYCNILGVNLSTQ
jgi:hypothetical protein